MEKLLFSYYGDDFTGSTDVMESIALNGVPSALFLKPPTLSEIEQFRLKNQVSGENKHKLQAFGVAGISRSLSPEQMDEELPPIFAAMQKIPAQFFQYKVCSTFDSSPNVGSIGHAAELAYNHFPSDFIPLLIGVPFLNRFSVFGNLFARVGEVTYRLDRHPTMSKHPATPMKESDLRIHLSHQTHRPVQLMDIFSLEKTDESEIQNQFAQLNHKNGDFILFDILNQQHLLAAGKIIFENASRDKTQLIVGSSGINYAILNHLQETGAVNKPNPPISPGSADRIIVMAGSAAPTTKKQLEWVISKGFAKVKIDTKALVNPETTTEEFTRVEQASLQYLNEGKSVAIFTALGPDDPQIEETKVIINKIGLNNPTSELIAGQQGKILKNLLRLSKIRRVVVAGGDTSGYVARALGITALETLMPIAPGAPLCTAHSVDPEFDGLEISLKGGQNGNNNYFESILSGEKLA